MFFTRQRIQRKTSWESSSTPEETGLFRKRRFTVQADPGVVTPRGQETPDLETQLNRAAHFRQRMSQVKVHGNRPVIQPKLAVGSPGDKYEHEADRVATQVMSMGTPAKHQSIQRETLPPEDEDKDLVQAKPLAASITPLVQREILSPEEENKDQVQAKPLTDSRLLQREILSTEEENKDQVQAKPLTDSRLLQRETLPTEEEDKDQVQAKPLTDSGLLQRETLPTEEEDKDQVQAKPAQQQTAKAQGFEASSNVESQLSKSKGRGSSLPDEVQAFMEPRFGADFSQVRVHTDGEAVQMNQELKSQAFTHGHDIYFGAGKSPGISELTAHELTHVVQQTGMVQQKPEFDKSEGGDMLLKEGKEPIPAQPTPTGLKIAAQAHNQVGSINYHLRLPSKDDPKKTEPKGWQLLNLMFSSTTGKKWPEDELKKTWRPGGRDWWGIFGSYCFQQGGMSASWSLSSEKASGSLRRLEPWAREFQGYNSTEESRQAFNFSIRPGDMGVISHFSRHFIVISVDHSSGNIATVDSSLDYGQILQSTHHVSELIAYYTPEK